MSTLNHGLDILDETPKFSVTEVEVEPEMSPPNSGFNTRRSLNNSLEEPDKIPNDTEQPEEDFHETTLLNAVTRYQTDEPISIPSPKMLNTENKEARYVASRFKI